MAKRECLHFLGALPVDTELVELLDASVEAEALAEHGGADQQTVSARETANGRMENGTVTNGHSEESDMKFPLLKSTARLQLSSFSNSSPTKSSPS